MEEWSEHRLEEEDWDEYDWEHFLRQADIRMAKYEELFETLQHHPQRDRLIAREMGWDRVLGDCEAEEQECSSCSEQEECEIYEVSQLWAATVSATEALDPCEEAGYTCGDLQGIAAYRKGHAFSMEVDSYFNHVFDGESAIDEDVLQAVSLSSMVPAKIAGGHGMGYERDALCGNIAYCKRALKCLARCVDALESVRAKALADARSVDVLVARAEDVGRAVEARIDELRSQVWWA